MKKKENEIQGGFGSCSGNSMSLWLIHNILLFYSAEFLLYMIANSLKIMAIHSPPITCIQRVFNWIREKVDSIDHDRQTNICI